MEREIIPRHGAYRRLKSFQIAQLIYDVTVRFCNRYVPARSRTRDQMVQAVRSGVQNIAEGSFAGGASREMGIKLTNVARASLEEPRLDYEDYLRQRGVKRWAWDDPRVADLIARRPSSADAFAVWVKTVRENDAGLGSAVIAANGALGLLAPATSLLDRQLAAQAKRYSGEPSLAGRLHQARDEKRKRATLGNLLRRL
jgi:four helix bundle suffix protein